MCGCSGEPNGVRNSNFKVDMTSLRELQEASSSGRNRPAPNDKVYLVDLHGKPAVHIQKDDNNHFFIISKVGNIFGLSIKIINFKLDYPKLDMKIEASFSPFDDGPFQFNAIIDVHCEDISKPMGCTIKIDESKTDKKISPLVNWDCLKKCAPQCISCGSDLTCWAACAAGCIFQCL